MPENLSMPPTPSAPAPSPSPAGADADLALLQRIVADVKSGRLRLPSLPDIALRIRAAANDPRRSSADVARVVQFDPALAT